MGLDGPGWRAADQAQSPEDTAATYRKARCWLLSIRSYPPVRALSILRRSRDAHHRHQRRISRADPGNGGRRNGAHQCHEPAHGTGDASLARIPSARERGWRSSSTYRAGRDLVSKLRRSEEPRLGKEWVRTGKTRWSPKY